jgi:hypothetical protein
VRESNQRKSSIDPGWVSTFDSSGYKLIMAKAVADPSGQSVYNVVASTTGRFDYHIHKR